MMTVTLDLPQELIDRLKSGAASRGVSVEAHMAELLDTHAEITPEQRAENYRIWLEHVRSAGDSEGDCSWDEILQRIDENRGDSRKHFPPEMKGITW